MQIDEKIAGMVALVIICLAAMWLLGAASSTIISTAVGAIAGFITGNISKGGAPTDPLDTTK